MSLQLNIAVKDDDDAYFCRSLPDSVPTATPVSQFFGSAVPPLRLLQRTPNNFHIVPNAGVTLQRLTPTCAGRVKFHPTRWHKLGFLITKHFFNVGIASCWRTERLYNVCITCEELIYNLPVAYL